MSATTSPRPKAPGRMRWICLEDYAENRDGWARHYRDQIDRDLSCGDGDEQWVRLRDGSEVEATWHDGQRGSLDGHWEIDGEPVEPTHVGVVDNRSGRHVSPRLRVSVSDEELARCRAEAARAGLELADWVRSRL